MQPRCRSSTDASHRTGSSPFQPAINAETSQPSDRVRISARERAKRALGLATATLAAVLASTLLARVALADATPVQLILVYMPNVSNTGTPAASGIAELVMPEGEVRIHTADLPRLEDDEQYVAWLVNSATNEFERLGAFNTAQSSGAVRYENVLPDAIPDKHWNLFLVTVEDTATPERPSATHSIAGVFPSADDQPLPVLLPNTGGDPDAYDPPPASRPEWIASPGLAALALVVGVGAGYALGRRTR
jgi:hypothetical protein